MKNSKNQEAKPLFPPPVPAQHNKVAKKTTQQNATALKAKDDVATTKNNKTTRRISNEFERTEESLYVSALEDM